MPAPEDLNVQTPGEQTAAVEPVPAAPAAPIEIEDQPPAPPVYAIKHNGGTRFIVVDSGGEKVGEFVGAKAEALAEADRLNAGGEPLAVAPVAPAATAPAKAAAPNAATLKQPVMTADGWLCPEPAVKE